jgi:hypothetical protein
VQNVHNTLFAFVLAKEAVVSSHQQFKGTSMTSQEAYRTHSCNAKRNERVDECELSSAQQLKSFGGGLEAHQSKAFMGVWCAAVVA